MAFAPPQELTELLSTDDRVSAERAWRTFLERHSRYLLSAARCFTVDYDGSMDRYRFILEELQREDYKRLRTYSADPSSRFSTWLVVVARRLCYDYHRKLYGRDRSTDPATRETRAVRRRLVDMMAKELDPAHIEDPAEADPEQELRVSELSGALEGVLSGLEPEERLLLKLRFDDGLPVSKVARSMRYPTVFHVYRKLNPLLARLRTQLEERGVGDPYP